MAKPNRPSAERLIEAPIIHADKIPAVSLNGGIVDLTLATLIEVLEDENRRQRLIVVADIKMPLATATALRDLLDKIILAAQPTPGGPISKAARREVIAHRPLLTSEAGVATRALPMPSGSLEYTHGHSLKIRRRYCWQRFFS